MGKDKQFHGRIRAPTMANGRPEFKSLPTVRKTADHVRQCYRAWLWQALSPPLGCKAAAPVSPLARLFPFGASSLVVRIPFSSRLPTGHQTEAGTTR